MDIAAVSFRKGSKVWHTEIGWCKYNRPLLESAGYSYVETKAQGHPLVKVLTNDLFAAKPPKPSRQERDAARFASRLAVIESKDISYWVAGWVLSHRYKFNISHPPSQFDKVVEAAMRYDFTVADAIVTQSTDKTQGWSCSVVVDEFGEAERVRLEKETGVKATLYHGSYKLSMQQKEFVLGFLGGVLKFRLGEEQQPQDIRQHVPQGHLEAFTAGFLSQPIDLGEVVPMDAGLLDEQGAAAVA